MIFGCRSSVHYDDWAARYDADTKRFGWCAPQHVLAAVDRHAAGPPRSVLDLGVGTGQCSLRFVHAGAAVVGIDASAAMLGEAGSRGHYHALHQAALGEQKLRAVVGDQRFDLVLACGVLHFVQDLGPLLDQIADILTDRGLVCFTTIGPQPRAFSPATRVRAPEAVASMLLDAGATVLERECFVAYYARGHRDEPVRYNLFVATREEPREQPSSE